MRIWIVLAALLAFASMACAKDYGDPSAFTVSPLHNAQVVHGDDGMDHVEYDLLVVSVLPEPVTMASVTVLDLGKGTGSGSRAMRSRRQPSRCSRIPPPPRLQRPPPSRSRSTSSCRPARLRNGSPTKSPTSSSRIRRCPHVDVPMIDAPDVAVDRQSVIRSSRRSAGKGGSTQADAASQIFTAICASPLAGFGSKRLRSSRSTGRK